MTTYQTTNKYLSTVGDGDGIEYRPQIIDQDFEFFNSNPTPTQIREYMSEVRREERERVREWAKLNEFDVEKAVNDPTSDFIAHDAYESKVEAFYEGYNQALKELTAYYTTT